MPSPAAAVARLPPTPLLRRLPPRAAVAAVAAVAGLAGAWLLVRDSSLVAVERVTVIGASGPQAAKVRAALEDAARDMTTLHVREDELRTAVAPYPIVRAIEVHPDPPDTLRIVVREHLPVAALQRAGHAVAVAADGTVLSGVSVRGLPVVPSRSAPGGGALDGRSRAAIALLAAAPAPLRGRVARLATGPKGWTAQLRRGPRLIFGRSARARAKWIAAARVLGDRSSAGATYIDLRLPERPAAGGVVDPAQQVTADAAPAPQAQRGQIAPDAAAPKPEPQPQATQPPAAAGQRPAPGAPTAGGGQQQPAPGGAQAVPGQQPAPGGPQAPTAQQPEPGGPQAAASVPQPGAAPGG
jgi:cell division protein FtsQ